MPVGRLHQRELLEAWLPDAAKCSCISRTAFEFFWTASGDSWILACGSGSLSVDGKVAIRNTTVPLRPGSEVVFTYERRILLRLHLVRSGSPTEDVQEKAFPLANCSAKAVTRSFRAISRSRQQGSPSSTGGGMSAVAAASVTSFTRGVSADASTPADHPARSWSTDRVHTLGPDMLRGGTLGLAEQAWLLKGVHSVEEAVMRLNAGDLQADVGFCIVHCSAEKSYVLLYEQGMQEDAFAQLGIQPEIRPDTARAPSRGSNPLMKTSRRPSASAKYDLHAKTPAAGHWRLKCILAEGVSSDELAALPVEKCSFDVPEGIVPVGRHHQPHMFGAWLPDPVSRFSVAWTHLELKASAEGLSVTNMSRDPLRIERETICNGERRMLHPGHTMGFLRQEDGKHVEYLMLAVQLRAWPSPAVSSTMTPASSSAAFSTSASTAFSTSASTVPQESMSSNGGMLRESALGMPLGMASPTPGSSCSRSNAAKNGRDLGGTKMLLELCGDGVLDVPLAQRCIGPVHLMDKPILVGRRHQPDLFERAMAQQCLELHSRDHFCIACDKGEYYLLVLTPNPIWRDRDSEETMLLSRDDLVRLMPGDRVVLGSGKAGNGEISARSGIFWRFHLEHDDAKALMAGEAGQ